MCTVSTYHQLMFSAVYSQLFESNGQVVYTNASIPIYIKDLKQHFKAVILLRASTDVTAVGWRLTEVRMPIIWARWRRLRVMPASSSFPSTGVDPWVGLNGSTLAENITKQSGHQRALLVHHAPVLRQKKKKKKHVKPAVLSSDVT